MLMWLDGVESNDIVVGNVILVVECVLLSVDFVWMGKPCGAVPLLKWVPLVEVSIRVSEISSFDDVAGFL